MRVTNPRNHCSGSWITIFLLCLVITLGGCVQIRQLTYPETFTWIGKEDISSSMQSMARSIAIIDKLVMEEKQPGANREYILDALENIEHTAAELSIRTPRNEDGYFATNHLLIDEHMENFLEDIVRAKIRLQASPSNYYSVGQLTGSCMGCHRMR